MPRNPAKVAAEDAGEGAVAAPIHRRLERGRVSGGSEAMSTNGEAESSSGTGLSGVLNDGLRR